MRLHCFSLTKKRRLIFTICISLSFFLLELIFGFRTGSLALIADAFHYLNDLIGFSVAFAALLISERSTTPKAFSFGWQRGQLLGGFFNGVFLLALGISIFLQSIERFIDLRHVDDPIIVLIIGSIGLFLNIITLLFLHDHGHGHHHHNCYCHAHNYDGDESFQENDKAVDPSSSSSSMSSRHHEHRHAALTLATPGHDLGMLGVILHVVGDAVNNIGVMVVAIAIWKAEGEARFYADPAVSLFIAVMIFLSAFPLVKNSGLILLQSAPLGVDLEDIKHDLEKIPGVESVHELHVWSLNERKAIASVHVVVSDESVPTFIETAKHINECLHAYGVYSTTLQPELPIRSRRQSPVPAPAPPPLGAGVRRRAAPQCHRNECQLICARVCEGLMCCKVKREPAN